MRDTSRYANAVPLVPAQISSVRLQFKLSALNCKFVGVAKRPEATQGDDHERPLWGGQKSAVCGRPNGMIGVQVLGGSKRADRRSCLTSDRAPEVHHVSTRPTSRFPLSLA